MKSVKKISTKLLLGFGAMLAVVLALSYSSLSAIGGLGGSLDLAVNRTAKKLQLVGDLLTGFQEMRANATKVEISLINTQVGQIDTHGGPACSTCHTTDRIDTQKQEFGSVATRLRGQIAELRPLAAAGETESLNGLDGGIRAWPEIYQRYLKLVGERDFVAAHDIMLNQIYPLVDTMDKAANQLAKQQRRALVASSREAHTRISLSRLVAFVLIGLCFLAGGGVHWILAGVNRVLRYFAGEMKSVSDQMNSAAREMARSSQSLAEGATEQIRSITHNNTGLGRNASGMATDVERQISEANQLVDDMVVSMQAITLSSGKISNINKVIDEIAFQTNILALNAAVEAARAGEAGMGFAVVADEVRNLAQRSAQAAKDATELIQESILRSNEGSAKLDRVAAAIRLITGSSVQVRELMKEVETGGQEQAHGIEQIATSLVQIEQVTQRVAASSEENAAASEELNAQSEVLKSVVEKLRELV